MAVKVQSRFGAVLKMSAMGVANASFRFIGGRPRTSSIVRTKSTVVYAVETDCIPHVSARHVGGGAVRIDVIAAILRVVFHDKNQSVVFVHGAVGDFLHQQSHGIVVVGLIAVRGIQPSIAVPKFPV